MSIDKSSVHDSHRFIVKSAFIIALGTLFSRILGFIRDIILAKFFGTAFRADAFFVAFRLPNLLRDLMGEGATNSAVVPVFSEYINKKNPEGMWHFVNVVLVWFFIILTGASILGIVLAPWIVPLIAPGFKADAQKMHLTVQLTQLLFPYLIFIGLTAYSMGILYTFRSFVWPALSPCLLNIAMIISVAFAVKKMDEPAVGLAVGVLVGGFLQLGLQLWALKRMGMTFTIPRVLKHPGAEKIGRLLLPRLFGSGVYQLNVFIDTLCASLSSIVGPGGISAIYYANRLIQFPQGIFGIAMVSALLPTLSSFVVKKDYESLRNTLLFSLRNMFLVMVPVSVITGVLATPIVRVLFERGEFNQESTAITAWALFWFAPGLLFYGVTRIMVSTFHALQDTVTPVKTAGRCLFINAILNFCLMVPLKVGGIALASSISVFVNFTILFCLMDKRLDGLKRPLVEYVKRLGIAGLIMGLGMWALWNLLNSSSESIKIAIDSLFGLALFVGMCLMLGIEDMKKILTETLQRLTKIFSSL